MSTPRFQRRTVIMLVILLVFFVPLLARAALYAAGSGPRSWQDADWSSTGALPPAREFEAARLIVFTGTTGAWKGIFSVHSWVVFKRAGAKAWTRANGWPADGRWYGNMPVAIADVSSAEAERLIPKVEATIEDYRFNKAGDYRIWPGPNSNSFTAAVLRAVPELGVTLPPNAVGRDFRAGFYAGRTDSGTGAELNLWGLADVKIGWVEGIEVNLLGLVAGLDLRHPGVKLPGFGRIGVEAPVATAQAR
jgi:hypothetical protein